MSQNSDAEMIDLQGKTLMPSFIDAHSHFFGYANSKLQVSLEDAVDFEDIANAVWYFGSDNSKNTTGAELTVDGGNMIQLYPIVSEK